MKKLIRLLSLILSLVMTISLFTACGEDDEEVVVDPNAKVVSSSRVDLANFEQWNPDFAVLKIQKLFGVIRRNKDPKYCHGGNYSAKVMPIGGHIDPSVPTFWIPTSSQDYNYSYIDFSYVDYVTTWIYNDEDVDKDITVGLVGSYTAHEKITQLGAQTFTLKSKQWNCVQYFVDFGAMALGSKVTADNIVNVKGIYYTFDTNPSPYVEDADVFYFDDVSIIYKETVNTFNNPVSFDKNDPNMSLCDFEKVWHKNLFYAEPNTSIPAGIPTVQVVTSKTLEDGTVVSPTSGARMLEFKYDVFPTSAGHGDIWHKITLPESTMAEFWATYVFDPALCDTDQQGNITSYEKGYIIPRKDWDKYYFTYDVYLATPYYSYMTPYYYANKTNWGGTYQKFPGGINVAGPKRNAWVTIKVSLDKIASIDITRTQHKAYYTQEYRILDPGDFSFTFSSQNKNLTEDFKMVYYLDSFRLTKDASL